MRLTYNILWIENELDWLEASQEFAEGIAEENGFELICVSKTSESEIEDMLDTEEPLKEFDFILVDFQLDSGDRGNKIIKNIRDHNIYTDVLFYSQDKEGVLQTIKDNWLDGVYCSSRNRDEFEDKFERIFKRTIKKIQSISSMRGLVLSETSQLDNIIEEILHSFFKNRKEDEKNELNDYIKKSITKSYKDNKGKIEALNGEIAHEDLVNHRLFDSYKKMRATGKILELLDNTELIGKDYFIKEYNEEVIKMRNDLAHAKEIEKEGGNVLNTFDGDKQFDSDSCITIRNNLRKHYEYLEKIQKHI
jgi:hypothetical protein